MLQHQVNIGRAVGHHRALAHARPAVNWFRRSCAFPVPFAPVTSLQAHNVRPALSPLVASALATASISAVPELQKAVYKHELTAACEAVRLASKLCQAVQRQLADAEKVEKSDSSPVTVADYGAQALVAWVLSRAFPGTTVSMVAEEDSADLRAPEGKAMLERITQLVNSVLSSINGSPQITEQELIDLIDLGQSPGGSTGQHWVLDPIDGTRGFVGQRQYAVCLGLLQDGEVVLGVLGCPNLPQNLVCDADGQAGASDKGATDGAGCLFLAHRNCGAYAADLWDAESSVQRIHVHDVQDFSGARYMESYESRHSNHSLTAELASQVGIVLPSLRMDSQVKYGLLSRGDASIFMRFPPATYREKIWDHCAGFVIVEEAGGKVTDGAGQRLDFSKGRYLELQHGIIAAPPAVHGALVDALKKINAASSSN